MIQLSKKNILSEVEIDKASPEPIHLQLYKSLKQVIIRHRLGSGFIMPSERSLANEFDLNRNTVHRAYESLREDGFVCGRPGSRGVFIADEVKNLYQPSFPCIGILLTCSFSDFLAMDNKLGMNYLSGVIDCANELKHSTMIVNLPHTGSSRDEVLEWRDELFDRLSGIIYFGDRRIKDDFAFESLVNYKNLPQVFVSGYSPYPNVSSVVPDIQTSGVTAAKLLSKNGYCKVEMLFPDFDTERDWGFINVSSERHNIMKKCFESCGIQVGTEWSISGFKNGKAIEEQLDRVFSYTDFPRAFWCQNDFLALRVLDYCRQRGIRIPDDVSLIGFDDIEEAAQSDPPLTSIKVDSYRTGRSAVELLIDLFENGYPGESRVVKIPTSLSCRQSVGKIKHKLREA
jgi:LacI family transcriptional regulator